MPRNCNHSINDTNNDKAPASAQACHAQSDAAVHISNPAFQRDAKHHPKWKSESAAPLLSEFRPFSFLSSVNLEYNRVLADELTHLIAKIERLQADAIGMRVTADGKQKELKRQIDTVLSWDASLVRLYLAAAKTGNMPDIQQLEGTFNAAQAARNSFGPLEVEIDRLGLQLARIELAVMEKSEQYRHLTNRLGIQPSHDATKTEPNSDITPSNASEPSNVPQYKYDLLSPSEIEAVEMVYQLEDQQIPVNGVSNEQVTFAETKVEDVRLKTAPPDAIEPEVASDPPVRIQPPVMRQKSLAKPGFPTLYWMDDSDGYRPEFNNDSFQDLQTKLTEIAHIGNNEFTIPDQFPVPNSIIDADLEHFDAGPRLANQKTTRGRINRWLLHILQTSISEKMLFLSMFPKGLYPPSFKSDELLRIWDEAWIADHP